MGTKQHEPEDIVAKLRQADVLLSQGRNVADVIRALGMTEMTDYRRRKEFGGPTTDQVRRTEDLEVENQRRRSPDRLHRPKLPVEQRPTLHAL